MNIGCYAKAIVAAATAAAVAAQTAVSARHGELAAADWTTIAVAALGALGVYLWPNQPPSSPSAPRLSGGAP